MIIFLYGLDSYRRSKKLSELTAAYRQKHATLDLLVFDLEEEPEGWLKIKEFLEQPSLFVESKIAILKNINSVDEKNEKALAKLLKTHIESQKTFILISQKDEPKKAFKFLLEKPVQAQAFTELTDKLLDFFLRQEAETRGLVFAPEAWRFFISYINSQLEKSWLAVNELEKLRLAFLKAPLSLANLKSLIYWSSKEDIAYSLQDIVLQRDFSKRVAALERLFLQKEEPARLFNALVYRVRGNDILRLADYDVSIKSGGLEYEEALTDFVIGNQD